ncbi:MAG: pyridoxal phosphate enzyme (YggS family) [Verrucomicrobiales bacterium]
MCLDWATQVIVTLELNNLTMNQADSGASEAEIKDNITDVLARMSEASERAGRSSDDTQLLVVSKTWPSEMVRRAAKCGQIHFGESRAQEVLDKVPALDDSLHWHFIGHLQKNKARKIINHCETLHSIDSLELAQQVSRIAGEEDKHPNIYLQVNVARDAAKFGFTSESVAQEIETALALPHVSVVGLMTIPAFSADAEDTRRHFAALRELRDSLSRLTGATLPGLSMGMSGDFVVAIEEGSTIVRVGTAIFGKRPKPPPTAK